MNQLKRGTRAAVGLLLTLPLTAILYVGEQLLGLPFVPFTLFDWLTRVLPGPLITLGIDTMIDTMLFLGISVVDTAKPAEQATAIILFVLVGVVLAELPAAIAGRGHRAPGPVAGLIMGSLFGLPLIAISAVMDPSAIGGLRHALLLFLFLGWGVALGWSYRKLASAPAVAQGEMTVARLDRRRFLVQLGASTAVISVAGTAVGRVLAVAERRQGMVAAQQETGDAVRPLPNAGDPVIPAPGTRPELTPLQDHYKVFIRSEPSVVDGATWVLPITGLVRNRLTLTLDDIRNNYPARRQYVTLSCISGRVGTDLIGTTVWTGVSAQAILRDAGVQESARYLQIHSADGYYETVSLDLIMADERIMFCYAWDDRPLPVEHGFPLRIWLPDRYGMKQPKWITGIEVTDRYQAGYWVERKWDEVARVKTTSVIDTVAIESAAEVGGRRLVPVGGIAFAGDRQVSRVEVRVDGGAWQEARLRAPLSETTWVIWRFDWPFEPGEHRFEVRCAEGDGTGQIERSRPTRPSGATGIHRYRVGL